MLQEKFVSFLFFYERYWTCNRFRALMLNRVVRRKDVRNQCWSQDQVSTKFAEFTKTDIGASRNYLFELSYELYRSKVSFSDF